MPFRKSLKFAADVKKYFEESKKRYSAVKIYRKISERGITCSAKRVQRHMQRQDLYSVVVKNIIVRLTKAKFLMIKKMF